MQVINNTEITIFALSLTFNAVITVSWCFLTASCENSDVANKHILSNARYLKLGQKHKWYCHIFFSSFFLKVVNCISNLIDWNLLLEIALSQNKVYCKPLQDVPKIGFAML